MDHLRADLASLRIDRRASSSRRRRWPLLLIALLLLALGAGAWQSWQWATRPVVQTVKPQVTMPGAGDPPGAGARGAPLLTASGYVVARKEAVVSSKIQGRLSELRVEEGSRLEEGDVIARLESSDYEAQIEKAKAVVERSEAELLESRRLLKLAEDLHKSGAVSTDELDAARSRERIAQAWLREARADLGVREADYQNTIIIAPFSGVVIKKMAEVGESVAPIPPGVNVSTSSGAIVVLADMKTLEVEADVNESHIAKLRPNHPAEVAVDAFPARRFQALLRQIIPAADRTKATVMVKVTILERDDNLKPEMSARVTFLETELAGAPAAFGAGSGRPVVTVPRQAVLVTALGQTLVFAVVDGKAAARPVVLGQERQEQVVVREGLAGNEVLILSPPEGVADGERVRVRED